MEKTLDTEKVLTTLVELWCHQNGLVAKNIKITEKEVKKNAC